MKTLLLTILLLFIAPAFSGTITCVEVTNGTDCYDSSTRGTTTIREHGGGRTVITPPPREKKQHTPYYNNSPCGEGVCFTPDPEHCWSKGCPGK